jgi:hypothetical protein
MILERPWHQAWQHVVYVGIFSLESVFEALAQAFPSDGESFDERPDGESALAAFVVSGEGCPLIGSEVPSIRSAPHTPGSPELERPSPAR